MLLPGSDPREEDASKPSFRRRVGNLMTFQVTQASESPKAKEIHSFS